MRLGHICEQVRSFDCHIQNELSVYTCSQTARKEGSVHNYTLGAILVAVSDCLTGKTTTAAVYVLLEHETDRNVCVRLESLACATRASLVQYE